MVRGRNVINRVLAVMVLFSIVAVMVPRWPTRGSEAKSVSKQCWEIRDELMDAVERGQLTYEQIRPIIKRCNSVKFE